MDDECMRIYYKDRLGICVLGSINDLCLFLAVAWSFVIAGGALVVSKRKDAASPHALVLTLLSCCMYSAMLDPSKWPFAIASLVPSIFFFVCTFFDYKRYSVKR